MREIVRTNDPVLITAIEALLKGANIRHMVLDQNMSVLEGSIGMLPRRIVVDEDHVAARAAAADGRRAWPRAAPRCRLKPITEDAVLGGALLLRQPTARPPRRARCDPACRRDGGALRRTRSRSWRGRRRGGPCAGAARRGADVTLVEIDPALAALAQENAARNGLADRVRVVVLDVRHPDGAFADAGIAPGSAARV